MPFLLTTKILNLLQEQGIGREQAHEAIKRNAVDVAKQMRLEGTDNNLLQRLQEDPELDDAFDILVLEDLLSQPLELIGAAIPQVAKFNQSVAPLESLYPEWAAYNPGEIL